MTRNEIKEQLRSQLSGDFNKDKDFLSEKSEAFIKQKNQEGVYAVTDLLIEIMPDDYQKGIMDTMYIDGKRLDKVYQEVVELINLKRYDEAMPMAEMLYNKIVNGFKEDETSKFVSLRNTFEDNIYQIIFKPEKTLNRAPFDLARIISAYGFLLVDEKNFEKAEVVLKKASEYNPVDCGPKFELTEAYKLQKDKDKILELTKETLKVASSPISIARCYTNLGYMCFDLKEYDDAVVFYYTSMLFYPHPAVNAELRNIAMITGQKLVQPDKNKIMTVFEKYGLVYGPNQTIVEIAAQLSEQCLSNNDIKNALIYLKILYGLTNDPKIKDIILKYEPQKPEETQQSDK